MKLSLAILCSALGAAAAKSSPFARKVTKNTRKARRTARLLEKATAVRKLEQDEQELDLTSYSLKFEKCQFVKQYPGEGEEQGGGEDNQSIFVTKRFVIFRLCPDSSCSSCNYNYGEYIVAMEDYLEAVLEFKQEAQEQYCETCNQCYEKAQEDDDGEDDEAWKCYGMDTSTCYAACQNIENMEDNGYVDASELTQCQELDYEDNNNNNNGNNNGEEVKYYVGAMCAGSGSRIKIGIFGDEDCSNYIEDMDIEDYMKDGDGYNLKLSYHLLKQTFPEGECVASCLVEDEEANNPNNDDDNEEEPEMAEVCENLYEAAGKCESSHGFADGIVDYDNYDNQVRNEELVCSFISTIKAGHYDQTGEIVVSGGRKSVGGASVATGGQKFALTFFLLGSLGLAGYVFALHQQLTKDAKTDLSGQGGTMA